MGDSDIYAKAAESDGEVTAAYSIKEYYRSAMPDSYRNLIISRWLRSLRYGNDFFKLVAPECYYEAYQHYIKTILAKPEVRIRLAVLTDDYDVVLGFSVSRETVLDYVHVHKFFRRVGIGTWLLPQDTPIHTITHLTRTALSIWASSYSDWKFNPFA